MSIAVPHFVTNVTQSGSNTFNSGSCAWNGAAGDSVARTRFRTAGTIAKYRAKILTNTTTANSFFDFREDNVSTGVGLTITAGATGYFEDVNTLAVVSGDNFTHVVSQGTGGVITYSGCGFLFTATSDTVARLISAGNADMGVDVDYFALFGALVATVTESEVQIKAPTPGTAKNLLCRLDQNTATATATVRLRKNETNTALVISIGAGLTGVFEDLVNSESIVLNDRLNYVIDGGGGGTNLSVRLLGIDFVTGDDSSIQGASVTASFNPGISETAYTSPSGRFENDTTESQTQLRIGDGTWRISKLGLYVSSNAATTNSNFRSRKNVANGNLNVIIIAATTGHFQDTSGQDSISSTDEISFSGITSTGGGFNANQFYYKIGVPGGGSGAGKGSGGKGKKGGGGSSINVIHPGGATYINIGNQVDAGLGS